MNFTSLLIKRSLLNDTKSLTIVCTDNEQGEFSNFLERLGHRLIRFEHLYYGSELPDLVLCNNKILHYQQCRQLSLTYHIPSIIVDHAIKNDIYNNDKIKFLDNLPSSFKIATSIEIYQSWHKVHDKILPFNNSQDCIINWSNFLSDISQQGFDL